MMGGLTMLVIILGLLWWLEGDDLVRYLWNNHPLVGLLRDRCYV